MRPIEFGSPERRLIGIYHPHEEGSTIKRPVLICGSILQESISAHRFERVVSDRLAKAGRPVLRFDYFGSRDAMGDELELGFAGAIQDAVLATKELRRLSGVDECCVIGVRFGANVALRTAMDFCDAVRHLVMVDPIVDGPKYLSEIGVRGEPVRHSARSLECDGFAVSEDLAREILDISLRAENWRRLVCSMSVIAEGEERGSECARPSWLPNAARFVPSSRVANWTKEEAEGTSLVPAGLVSEVVKAVER